MYTKYEFVFYLNLKFWQVFNKIVSSEYVIQFLLRLDLFSDEKYDVQKKEHLLWKIANIVDVEKKEHLLWKIANIVAFSSRRPYETKYSPFKDLHGTQNFSSFYLKMCKLII